MKTWTQFYENKEPKKNKEEMLAFFKKRKAGAAKIATQAKEKGGPSILTYWHFSAKSKPYEEILKAIESNQDEDFYMSRYDDIMKRLHKLGWTQKQFQEIMGELEVMGEVIAQLF